jgi:hypothetical protein
MKTDDLIDALSRHVEPTPPPRPIRAAAMAALPGLGVAVLILAVLIGVRPDYAAAMPQLLAKAGASALLAGAGGTWLAGTLTPGRAGRGRLAMAAGLTALLAGVGIAAGILTPAENRFAIWLGGGFPWCLVLIPLLAAPVAVGLVVLARRLAPVRLTTAGAAIGATSGAVGAMVYAMHCPVDQVAFVGTWYAAAIALCAGLGALMGSRLLRW